MHLSLSNHSVYEIIKYWKAFSFTVLDSYRFKIAKNVQVFYLLEGLQKLNTEITHTFTIHVNEK